MKKLGLLFLAAMILAGLFTVSAYADEDGKVAVVTGKGKEPVSYTTLQEAMKKADDEDKVTLIADTVEPGFYLDRGSVHIKIDLNGHCFKAESSPYAFKISNKVTISDGSKAGTGVIESDGKWGVVSDSLKGLVVINGGTIKANIYATQAQQGGKLIINNGLITTTGGNDYGISYGVSTYGEYTVMIRGGVIKGDPGEGQSFVGVDLDPNRVETAVGSLTISGGEIYGIHNPAIMSYNNTRVYSKSIHITGGKIQSSDDVGILHDQEGVLNISGGQIKGKIAGIMQGESGTINISGDAVVEGETGIDISDGILNILGGSKIKSTAKETAVGPNRYIESFASGAAVGFAQRGDEYIVVNISGGTLTGPAALYGYVRTDNVKANPYRVSVTVIGGKLSGSIENYMGALQLSGSAKAAADMVKTGAEGEIIIDGATVDAKTVDNTAGTIEMESGFITADKLIGSLSEEWDAYIEAVNKAKALKTKIKKLVNSKGKKLKVTFAKKKGCTGYQVRCATNKALTKNVKTAKAGASKDNVTLKGLKKKKTYYVSIRTYTTVMNPSPSKKMTIYGSWSAPQKITIKK